jgi:hypothetical protein
LENLREVSAILVTKKSFSSAIDGDKSVLAAAKKKKKSHVTC